MLMVALQEDVMHEERNYVEDSTCRVVVVKPSSGFKSILQGVGCMSKNGQAVAEG